MSRRSADPDYAAAALWTLGLGTLLSLIEVGWIANALAFSNRFQADSWFLNPNHLLMEPTADLLYHLPAALGIRVDGVDRQLLMSIWTGALSLGLFRGLIAPALTDDRLRKELATTAVAGGWAFLSVWISGRPHILHFPILVLTAWQIVRYMRHPGLGSSLILGALFGLASLFFASSAIIGLVTALALGIWRSSTGGTRPAAKETAALLVCAGIVGMSGAVIGWFVAKPDSALLSWMLGYAGEANVFESTRYGALGHGPRYLATAFLRALYGAARAITDVSPLADLVQGRSDSVLLGIGSTSVCLIGAGLLGYRLLSGVKEASESAQIALVITLSWASAVLVFGTLLNTAGDHFFFQLAIPMGVMVAGIPLRSSWHRRIWRITAAVVVVWNVALVYATRVDYPLSDRMNELTEEVNEAELVVFPGYDETNTILNALPDSVYDKVLSLMVLSHAHEAEQGLEVMADSISQVLCRNETVRAVSIFEAVPSEMPWKDLSRAGYDRHRVVDALNNGFERRQVGGQEGAFDTYELSLQGTCVDDSTGEESFTNGPQN